MLAPFLTILCILLCLIICEIETGSYYHKTLGNEEEDKNGGLFMKKFFECNRIDKCTHVVKVKNSKGFTLVTGKDEMNEESEYDVIYEKMTIANQGWSAWSEGRCSKKCGGGLQNRTRHCLNEFGFCPGATSKTETCNVIGCPGFSNCTNSNTGSSPSDVKSFSLVKQNVKCNRFFFLKRFQLQQDGSNIKYDFSCCKLQNLVCNETSRTTPWNDDGVGNSVFLDRHQVDCGESSFLQDFILQRNATISNMRYAYTCCDVTDPNWKTSVQCQEKETAFTSDGDGNVFNLASHNVMCDDGYALSKVYLQRNPAPHGQWKYVYKCCKFEP